MARYGVEFDRAMAAHWLGRAEQIAATLSPPWPESELGEETIALLGSDHDEIASDDVSPDHVAALRDSVNWLASRDLTEQASRRQLTPRP